MAGVNVAGGSALSPAALAAGLAAVTVDPTGGAPGAVARTVVAHLADREVSAKIFAVGDGTTVTGAASITSGAATLTVVGAAFATADVGKAIYVPGAGAAGAMLVTTILSRTSATVVVLAANASTTLSAVSTTVGYGSDDTVALQAWLDHCRANLKPGYLPPGRYVTTDMLWATRAAFQTVSIRGAGSGYDTSSSSATRGASIIDASAVTTKPAVAFQSCRVSRIADICILGPNLAPAALSQPTNVAADHLTTGVRDSRYSPQCGIAIDPVSGSDPGGGGGYPGLTYVGASGSSMVYIERCQLSSHNVAIAVGPASGGTQGDQVLVTDCEILGAHIGIAYGQGQTDGSIVRGCNIGRVRRVFDTLTYGAQGGAPPAVYGGCYGPAYSLFGYQMAVKNAEFSRCYCESVKQLGFWGPVTNGSCALILHSIDFRTRSDWDLPPMLLQSEGYVRVDGAFLKDNTAAFYAINFVGTGQYELSGITASVQNALRLAIFAPYDIGTSIHLRSGRIYDGTNATTIGDALPRVLSLPGRVSTTTHLSRMLAGATKYSYTCGGGNNYRNTATASAHTVDTVAKTITVSLTTGTVIQVGDLIYWRFLAVAPSTLTSLCVGLRVTSVTGAGPFTVVMTMLYDPALYDPAFVPTSLAIHRHEWAPGAVCTLTKTSGSTTATVSPVATLKAGDWLTGTGLATDARVVSTDGAGNIVLNINATASSADACYWGRLFTATETAAF